MSSRKAFTLTELLVLVAIVCILSAILFPVVSHARVPAGTGPKRVGAAVLMYVADNDGYFPFGSGDCWWQPSCGGWILQTSQYLFSFKSFVSANDPQVKGAWPTWVVPMGARNISYPANGYMQEQTSGWRMAGVMGLSQPSWIGSSVRSVSEITHVDRTVMLAEAYNGYQLYGSSDFLTGVDWWDDAVGYGSLLPDYRRDGSPYIVNGIIQTQDNRNGALNALFESKVRLCWTDGHVSLIAPRATNPRPRNPDYNLWNSLRP